VCRAPPAGTWKRPGGRDRDACLGVKGSRVHPSRSAQQSTAQLGPLHHDSGARTVPHTHHNGQHLFIADGIGVVGDEKGVHVVRAGDVVSSLPRAWHWHGATPAAAMTHLTVEKPGDFDLDVDHRDWHTTYGPDLSVE
jgi:quercetin dioxygenase-like cupin family protein